MATGRGAFSISGLRAGVRKGFFVAGLAAVVVVAGLPAGADSPEFGADPNVKLTVSPSDGLTDGQTVMVSGTGFGANSAGLIRECGGSAAVPECDTTLSGIFFTDANGAFPPSPMTVNRVITSFVTSFNCGAQACALVADAGGKSSRHHISFAGAGTVGPTSSTSPTSTSSTSTIPPGSTVPTTLPPSSPTTTTPLGPIVNLLCAILQPVSDLLGGLLDGLTAALGCPQTG